MVSIFVMQLYSVRGAFVSWYNSVTASNIDTKCYLISITQHQFISVPFNLPSNDIGWSDFPTCKGYENRNRKIVWENRKWCFLLYFWAIFLINFYLTLCIQSRSFSLHYFKSFELDKCGTFSMVNIIHRFFVY